ncbi:MAG TPA: Asp-tRNA(Asn)/Glu-tRNA(Gln) amidotransferase subunit GatA [Vicinamibacterales bacterium]|nr:Asp-tRNA(Asn)/Glu-tRNA(Gln) amidotransferase subunit GatA [Vicinamibacterales bacterium]
MKLESARAIAQAIRDGQASAVEICRAALGRIDDADRRLNAFRSTTPEAAVQAAAALDARPEAWADLPLLGVPVAFKDNICTRGVPTTAGSRILEGYLPPFDATVVERLARAGAVFVGKTNCDEFAMGSSNENSAFGPTRNPWDADRTPGGSSGGSAAAVSARLVPLALGSDTGGSIRQPAAMCGVVGIKPSYGRVSRYGLLAFGSSLDQIGPLATSVADAALALQIIAGPDGRDATCLDTPVPDLLAALTGDVRGLRIGVPRDHVEGGLDTGVAEAFEQALDVLRREGAEVHDVSLPHSAAGIAVYYLISTAEASSNLARYDGVRYGYRTQRAESLGEMYDLTRDEGFGAEVKRRIMLGTFVLSSGYYDAYYLKAQQVRTLIRRDYEVAFERVDLIAAPTSPVPAFRLGERLDNPLHMYLADVFTVGANLAGLPAVSVPCGLAGGTLPVGFQLTGRPLEEATMLRAADAYERASRFSRLSPQL